MRLPALDKSDGKVYEKCEELASKHKEMGSITVVRGSFPNNFFGSLGNSYFKGSQKVIAIDPFIKRFDPDAAIFMGKHEFAHIKHNDTLKKYGALLLLNGVAAFFCENDLRDPIVIALATQLFYGKTLGRDSESHADDWAIEQSSEDELKGAVRFFAACILADAEIKKISKLNQYFVKFQKLIDDHPEDQERLTKVAKALKTKYKVNDFSKIIFDNRVDFMKNFIIFRRKNNLEDPNYVEKLNKFLAGLSYDAHPEKDPLRVMLSIRPLA